MTKARSSRVVTLGIGALAAVLAALSMLSAATASASYETVDHFGGTLTAPPKDPETGKPAWPEEAQLGGASGMAINRTGAGGVAPGTVYTLGFDTILGWHVARFSAEGDFELAWNASPSSRCGPKSTVPPTPPITCKQMAIGTSGGGFDVDVDQATGNVYVFNKFTGAGAEVISVYNPDATKLIAKFGELDAGGTIAASPGKFHGGAGGIAVNDAGEVYLYDEDNTLFHRLMVFKPESSSDYEHYVYAGQASDLRSGPAGTPGAAAPVLDEDGNVYALSSDDFIGKYDPSGTLVCSFSLKSGGIAGMTVNPAGGEPFYYSSKPTDRKIHQLSPCNGEGKFVPVAGGEFSATPQRGNVEAMAFNPARKFDPSRPAGVLYAAAGEDCPGSGGCPEPGTGPLGFILAQAPEAIPPEVVSESVTQVTKTSATLGAQVNPRGTLTTYAFQYVPQAAWEANEPADRFAGAIEVPLGGAVIGAGQEAISAAAALTGLIPDSAYHFRAVATSHCALAEPSKICEGAGEDRVFRTFPVEAPGSPDERAFELVSPSEKGGGQVLPAAPNQASCGSECKPGLAAARFPTRVGPNGDSIAYEGTPFTLNDGASEFDEHISKRAPTGWQTTSLSPPLEGDAGGAGFRAFGLDSALERAIVYAKNPSLTPQAPAGYLNLFAEQASDRFSLEPLLTKAPPSREPAGGLEVFNLEYAGASEDLSRVFFAANDALTLATPSAPDAVDGGDEKANLYEWSDGELHLVNVQPDNAVTAPGAAFGSGFQLAKAQPVATDFSNAISADGSRAYWSDEAGQVYLRENGETTIEVPDHVGRFLTASQDGSRVLLSDGVLYDAETKTSTDLTQGGGGFQGIAGQSDDLSSVYFVATAVLDETPNDQGATAKAGEPNLYAWHEGSIAYVATLQTDDNTGLNTWEAPPVRRTAQASPNGRFLAFGSKAELTGIDSIGACEYDPNKLEYVGSVPCPEVFLYDSQTDRLLCASCNPVGERPHGGSFLRIAMNATGSQEQARYLTDQGRLYFDSRDSLVVNDTNGKVEDVYQYEPNEIGTCKKQEGCVSLISAGHEPNDSNLLTADASGKNVFFTTRDRLSLKDKDDLIDLYVAREDGGIPAETELSRGECQGETCIPTYSPPNDLTPGSSTFQGSGNVNEKSAKKKAHKKKRRHAKKHRRAAKGNRGGKK